MGIGLEILDLFCFGDKIILSFFELLELGLELTFVTVEVGLLLNNNRLLIDGLDFFFGETFYNFEVEKF